MGSGVSSSKINNEYIYQKVQAKIKAINNDLVLLNNNKKYIKIVLINNTFRFIINNEMNDLASEVIIHLVIILNEYAKRGYLIIKDEKSKPLINIDTIEKDIITN